MRNKFGLIYFVHDDTDMVFPKTVIAKLIDVPQSKNIRVVLIHNQRRELANRKKELVTYKTVISIIATDWYGNTFFSILKDNISNWEKAFTFAFNYLNKEGYFDRIGLVTLSHSNGFVINKSGPDFLADEINQEKEIGTSFKSIIRKLRKDELYVNTQSILAKDARYNITKNEVYQPVYTRDKNSICQTYEGIFFSQLSVYLKKQLDKFGKKKLSFFISSNCNFQLYENIFLFSEVAEFTMGAESNNNIAFFHFPTIISAIENSLKKDTRIMCKLIFQLCSQHYKSIETDRLKHYFLVDCVNFMKRLHPAFNVMMGILAEKNLTNGAGKRLLMAVKKRLDIVSDEKAKPYFDALQVFNKAKSIIRSRKFDIALNKFESVVSKDSVIVSRYIRDGRDLCGFALYIPLNKKDFDKLKEQQCNYFGRVVNGKRNPFSKKTKYDEFLKHLHS